MKTAVAIAVLATMLPCGCVSKTPKSAPESAFVRFTSAVQKRDAEAIAALDGTYCRRTKGLKFDRDAFVELLRCRLSFPASTRYFGGALDSTPYAYRLYFPPEAKVTVIDVAQTDDSVALLEAVVLYPVGSSPSYVRESKEEWFQDKPSGFFVEHGHFVLDVLRNGEGPKYNLSSKVDEVDSLVLRARMELDSQTGQWVVNWLEGILDRSRFRSLDLATRTGGSLDD